jgi:WD40 repeat protein
MDPAPGAPPEIYRALFAPDEDWLLTASNAADRPVRLWNPRACTELPLPAALGHDSRKVQAAAVTAGTEGIQLVATGDDTGTLRLVRQDPGGDWTLLCQLKVHDAPIADLAFAPGGGLVATASEDGQAALVALEGKTGAACGQPRPLDGGADSLLSVAFAPDGASLVTATLDGRAQVWGLNGSLQANLVGHKDRIHYAEFSPDGHWILTASRDGSMRIWQRPAARDPGAGAPPDQGSFLTLPGDSGGVAYARFSPDGRSIGAAYWDNAAILWRLWSEDPNPAPALEAVWGKDRSRLTLIREAERFRRDKGLDGGGKGLTAAGE